MKKLLLLLFLSSIAFVSCDEGDLLETDRTGQGPKSLGFRSASENIAYFEDLGVKDYSIPVNLVGLGNGQLPTSDITVEFEVDVANSTAVEGVEFDFADAARSITIPAGSDFALINLKINTGSFNTTEKTEVVLKLKNASAGTAVSEKQKSVTIAFVGCLSQIIEGSYHFTSTAGYAGNSPLDLVDINTFEVNFPGLTSGGQPIKMQFTDICGEITLLGWDLDASYLCSCTSASLDLDTNSITFNNLKIYNGLTPTSPVFFDRKNTTYVLN